MILGGATTMSRDDEGDLRLVHARIARLGAGGRQAVRVAGDADMDHQGAERLQPGIGKRVARTVEQPAQRGAAARPFVDKVTFADAKRERFVFGE